MHVLYFMRLWTSLASTLSLSKADDWTPQTGPYLGDLIGEINGDTGGDDYIVEFVSGGPKCYAYRTLENKAELKCKGVTLTSHNASVVTPDTLILYMSL